MEKDILIKKPWKRVHSSGSENSGVFFGPIYPSSPIDNLTYTIASQADFMREYYPSGHAINNPAIYPDIYREEDYDILDENGDPTGKKGHRVYKEAIPRYAFAFQQTILVKQCVHLCGNDIQFELNVEKRTDWQEEVSRIIREGWLQKDMEVAFFESVKSVKMTGDAAFVGYLHGGKFSFRVFSFKDGYTLFPHYDFSGKLKTFAISYYDYDEEGETVTKWVEVWDKKYYSRFKQALGKTRSLADKAKSILGLYGFVTVVPPTVHGFQDIPVAYKRDDDGPCWSPSQDSIEGYELSFSQMAQNNQAFGEPILVLQSEGEKGIDIQHGINGSIKMLGMSTDDKASYLPAQSASESYMKQLDAFYKMIYEQSFVVAPPELKSGDLPAAALKILYSPAYEKAMVDAQDYQFFLNDMVSIFLYGYGVEKGMTIDFANCPLKWWIKPYVHTNESTVIQDLASSVQNGFLSRQTASEKIPFYATTDEWERIMSEKKREQEADLLFQLKTQPVIENGNETDEETN